MNLTITPEEREALLADARETIRAALERRPPEYKRSAELARAVREGKSALSKPCGAFVTLHQGKDLRGCIGRMIASEVLEKTVRIMAGEAACGDPRFPPLTRSELGGCTIEISALSPLERCPGPRSVQVGLHGLYLVHRGRSGVLLPQVPVEQGWDLDQYLAYICVKAGLPPHSYDEPGAQLYTFTAVVFGEEPAP
ncbi:MAG: AmmeMemoRadiSam system protein A [Spirochaetaceae bacterium]|jgi:AmmeMemoRadiSam system protein A|nr:AmmeMemoRadiSam system protein A [Spirochaetaceae bacterium]